MTPREGIHVPYTALIEVVCRNGRRVCGGPKHAFLAGELSSSITTERIDDGDELFEAKSAADMDRVAVEGDAVQEVAADDYFHARAHALAAGGQVERLNSDGEIHCYCFEVGFDYALF